MSKFAPIHHVTKTTRFQSADFPFTVCVHQLARAMEEYARKTYVPITGVSADFETAANVVAELIGLEDCPLRREH